MLLVLRFVFVSFYSRPTWEATAPVLTSRPTIRATPSVAARGISGLAWVPVLVSTSLLAGCGHVSRRTPIATPASHSEADDRPFTIQPPVDLDVENPNNAV